MAEHSATGIDDDLRRLVAAGAPGLKPFAGGKRAVLFRLPAGRILKLYHADVPAERAAGEWACTMAALAGGLPSWPVETVIEAAGRQALLGRYVRGPSVSAVMLAAPAVIPLLVRRMAGLQARLHRLPFDGGTVARLNPPTQIRQFLIPAFAPEMVERIETAAMAGPADAFCHGDFHGRNLVLSARGLVILDWDRAGRGRAATDVAKTLAWLTLGTAHRPAAWRLAAQSWLADAYLARYCRRSGLPAAPILAWTLVEIAKRCRGALHEAVLRRHLDRLASAMMRAAGEPAAGG